jgi:hypothetical protein
MELQEHEVQVENKDGQKLIVSAVYYARNKGTLKMLDDNGWEDKMDTLELNNKSVPNKTVNQTAAQKAAAKKAESKK